MDTQSPTDFHEDRGIPAGDGKRYPCVLIDVQAHPEMPRPLKTFAAFNFLPRIGERVEVATPEGEARHWLVVGIAHGATATAGCDVYCADPITPAEYVLRLCRAHSYRPHPTSRRRRK